MHPAATDTLTCDTARLARWWTDPAYDYECNFMRLNTLEKLYACLRDESPAIEVAPDIAARALRPIERMLDISAHLGL